MKFPLNTNIILMLVCLAIAFFLGFLDLHSPELVLFAAIFFQAYRIDGLEREVRGDAQTDVRLFHRPTHTWDYTGPEIDGQLRTCQRCGRVERCDTDGLVFKAVWHHVSGPFLCRAENENHEKGPHHGV